MNKIIMKIAGYDEASNSLLVSFASDETQSSNPDDYQVLAYQPLNMWPDVTDVEEIKKRIAYAGIYLVETQARDEAFKADTARIAALQALVGQVVEYPISELLVTEPEVIEQAEVM